ncbi:MAG: pectate lyase [Planctomycetota bacterium]|nr:pectate lyase [Planctomycetota bacterium]
MYGTQTTQQDDRYRRRIQTRFALTLTALLSAGHFELTGSADAITRDEARAALRRAVSFFRTQVSTQGGYLWRYSADLKRREGEGRAGIYTAWVQPPGTPSVGQTYLQAYHRTHEPYLLAAAVETGKALVKGQLQSGGWDYRIEFEPTARTRYAYRLDGEILRKRNVTTLDDNTTQSAVQFLIQLDQTLRFKDTQIHAATEFALKQLLRAQYPLGAWPQRYDQFPDPAKFPVLKANYPSSWSRQFPKLDYRTYYTFNDNTIADMITTMFLAARVYEEPRYFAAAERAGDFIIAAQMPAPQPAWAQQYDAKMQPAWARKFEPPAVTGGESQGVLRTLLVLFRHTGNSKYLAPVPTALKYLEQSQLESGQLARFYELQTNRPLYFTRNYELTYDDNDLPTHYGFKVNSQLDSIRQAYEQLLATPNPVVPDPTSEPPIRLTDRLQSAAHEVVRALNRNGAWIEAGRLKYQEEDSSTEPVIDVRTFIRNIDVLSRYLGARSP